MAKERNTRCIFEYYLFKSKIMTHGSLFSGIGAFDLVSEKLGVKNIWSKIYTDVQKIRNPKYVDIITAGFPCQDISIANTKKTKENECIKG
jgi:DNA (cytosine-5)-methyltransferase 1